MSDSDRPTFVMDPAIVKCAQAIHGEMCGPCAPSLGLDYRITIEVHGKPRAAVVRSPDEGIKMHFYAT